MENMITNQSDGVLKLTEYLKQTRRQAEIAIDNLNTQLTEVSTENQELRQAVKELEQEKNNYKQQLEQSKQQTSNKNKFKERDDWKYLVDNIQQDRDRLQEETNQLQSFLSTASQQIEELKHELERVLYEKEELEEHNKKLQNQVDELERQGVSESKDKNPDFLIRTNSLDATQHSNESSEPSLKPQLLSPVVDKITGRNIFTFDVAASPHAITKKLKDELLKAHNQVRFSPFNFFFHIVTYSFLYLLYL
jgi:chromosome segregation ATPase